MTQKAARQHDYIFTHERAVTNNDSRTNVRGTNYVSPWFDPSSSGNKYWTLAQKGPGHDFAFYFTTVSQQVIELIFQ